MAPSSSAAPAPIPRPLAGEVDAFYLGYIQLVPDGDVLEHLASGLEETRTLLARFDERGAEHRYAPGKWSVKQVVGHMLDAERVFAYRAMCITRGDETPLPGFEQDDYVATANFDGRSLADLGAELGHLRSANLHLFRGLGPQHWARSGTASNCLFKACAFPWIMAGHEIHHRRVLAERYLQR